MIDEIMDFDGMANLSLTSTNDVDAWITQLKKKEPLSLKEIDNLCKKVSKKTRSISIVAFIHDLVPEFHGDFINVWSFI